MRKTDEVQIDDCCSICLSVFYRPVRLSQCGHIFCRICLEQFTQLSNLKACPLCRSKFSAQEMVDDKMLQAKMAGKYPDQLKQKMANIKQKIVYKLLIGNTSNIANQNNQTYQWELFIRAAPVEKQKLSHYIQNIQVTLHPTFTPSKIVYDPISPILLRRIGWGTFRIDIRVNWKKEYGGFTDVYHDLKFEPQVSSIVTCRIAKK